MNVLLTSFADCFSSVLFMDAAAPPTAAPAGSGPFQAVIMVFLVLLALFFIFILPAKSRDKQTQKMIDKIKINDKVLTMGGVIGVVCSIDAQEGEIVLRVDDTNNVKIRFSISSVYYVYNKDAAKKDGKDKKDKDKDAKK